MQCDLNPIQLAAYLDGELPPGEAEKVHRHIGECVRCAAEVARQVSLKRSLRAAGNRFQPTSEFRLRVQKQIAKPKRSSSMAWLVPAMAAVVLLLLFSGWMLHTRRAPSFSEVADLHVATLASANPLDVVSTDRHTVKPWFQGRIPFTFNVPEFAGTEFALAGGRMTYLHQQPGAQLIVSMRQHKISVFIFQESEEIAQALPMKTVASRQSSFNVEAWKAQELRFVIIGDTDATEIHKLAEDFRSVNN